MRLPAAELELFNELEAKISERQKNLESLNTDISEKEGRQKQLNYKISELSSDIADSTLVAKAGVEKLEELDKEIQDR